MKEFKSAENEILFNMLVVLLKKKNEMDRVIYVFFLNSAGIKDIITLLI